MPLELKGNPHVRLLKSYVTPSGKKLPVGQVFRRSRQEAKEMISNGVAEAYSGPFPPKKMKTNFFKTTE